LGWGYAGAGFVWERALPVDRGLDFVDPQRLRAGRFVHIRSAGAETKEDDELEATVQAGRSDSPTGRVAYAFRRVLIGPALRSTAIAEERLGRVLALAVRSPDALSSVKGAVLRLVSRLDAGPSTSSSSPPRARTSGSPPPAREPTR